MRVVHVLLSGAASWGGPPAVVRDLVAALAPEGVESSLVYLTDPDAPQVGFPEAVRCLPCGRDLFPKLGLPSSPSLPAILLREIRRADVVHLHELWHVPQALGALLAATLDRPYVVTPHGEIDPWTLGVYGTFKAFAWPAYQKRILDRASGVHALTEREKADLESKGVRSPIRVIPNGVDIDAIQAMAHGAAAPLSGIPSRYAVFVGRLDPKKGLDVLLQSFADLAPGRGDTRLVLVGPDTLGLWPSLLATAARLGIGDRVTYAGFVDAPTKFRLLAGAAMFVLPSISEGMSVAVLEALACGVPCVVSTECHLPEIEASGAGRVVEPTPAAVSRAMSELLGDPDLRRRAAENAERLARAQFSIGRMATEMRRLYETCVARGS